MGEVLTELPSETEPTRAELEARLAEQRRAEAETTPPEEAPEPEAPEPEAEEEPAAPEPEPTPEPTPEPSPEAEAFNREYTRHQRAVQKILGDELPLVPCETCEGIGFMPPGSFEPPAYQEHAKYRACPGCGGEGVVKTGSKVAGLATTDCPDCNGRGFQERLHALAQPAGSGELYGPAGEPLPASLAGGSQPAEGEFGTPTWMGDARTTGS